MDLKECTAFANENPVCFIATSDGDQPRVRAFALWFADDTGFYFHSGSVKAVCKQLRDNPRTEVCFHRPGAMPDPGTMLRVAGEVEFLDDVDLKARLLEERPFLKDMGVAGPEDPLLAVFRIGTGEAYFWTMDANMHERQSDRVNF